MGYIGMGKYAKVDNMSTCSSVKSVKKKLSDYEFIEKNSEHLGKGAYGSVRLVREKGTGKKFALKIITKKLVR